VAAKPSKLRSKPASGQRVERSSTQRVTRRLKDPSKEPQAKALPKAKPERPSAHRVPARTQTVPAAQAPRAHHRDQSAGHRRETLRLRSGLVLTLRPIEIDDLKQAHSVFDQLSEQTRYFRYMRAVPTLTPELILESVTSRTQPSVILVATVRATEQSTARAAGGADRRLDPIVGGGRIEVADVAAVPGARPRTAEFALTMIDAWQGRGIGAAMLRSLCRRALAMGYRELVGDVLAVNAPMLALAGRVGFTAQRRADSGEVVKVRCALAGARASAARPRAT